MPIAFGKNQHDPREIHNQVGPGEQFAFESPADEFIRRDSKRSYAKQISNDHRNPEPPQVLGQQPADKSKHGSAGRGKQQAFTARKNDGRCRGHNCDAAEKCGSKFEIALFGRQFTHG